MAWTRKLSAGRYQGIYRDPADRQRSKVFPTKTAAQEWAAKQEAAARRGLHIDPKAGRITLREWHDRWWAARVAEPTTLAGDRSRLDNHVLPMWEDWPLDAITTLEVQGWVRRLGKPSGDAQPLAAASVHKCFNLLSGMLEAAVLEQLVPTNRCKGVKLPAVSPSQEVYLTEAEVDALVEHLREPLATAVYFMAYTGLRWAEVCGLRRSGLHLLRRQVSVNRTTNEINGLFTEKPYPKGKKPRQVPLADHVVERLARHLGGVPSEPGARVFTTTTGKPISRNNVNRALATAAKAAGVTPRPTVHDLRHTFASWLAQRGVPLANVQQLMGHSSVATTQRYAHLAPDAGEVARGALDRSPSAIHRQPDPVWRIASDSDGRSAGS